MPRQRPIRNSRCIARTSETTFQGLFILYIGTVGVSSVIPQRDFGAIGMDAAVSPLAPAGMPGLAVESAAQEAQLGSPREPRTPNPRLGRWKPPRDPSQIRRKAHSGRCLQARAPKPPASAPGLEYKHPRALSAPVRYWLGGVLPEARAVNRPFLAPSRTSSESFGPDRRRGGHAPCSPPIRSGPASGGFPRTASPRTASPAASPRARPAARERSP